MQSIITIGDLHGRPFWKMVNPDQYDKIVFMGDYVDSFTYSDNEILSNLLDIIEFKKRYSDKVVLLLGNHDVQYMFPVEGYDCSGYRPSMGSVLTILFNDNKRLFQMAYQVNNYIWTHAGISEQWYNYNKETILEFKERFECENIADIFNKMMYTKENRILHQIGIIRGGSYVAGGITWADREETVKYLFKDHHQIVGHTPLQNISKFGYESSSITYVDVLNKLEYFKDELKNLNNFFLSVEI